LNVRSSVKRKQGKSSNSRNVNPIPFYYSEVSSEYKKISKLFWFIIRTAFIKKTEKRVFAFQQALKNPETSSGKV
tara:strand:+ start:75 stop:299 length:225 start_codon:yes stop_codon:yes gene_type:complete